MSLIRGMVTLKQCSTIHLFIQHLLDTRYAYDIMLGAEKIYIMQIYVHQKLVI